MTGTDANQVSLIVATRNEVEGMKVIMPRIKTEWYDELLVVDGGSTDGTIEYCQEQGYPLYQQSGLGLPNALDEAFRRTTKGIVVTFSPDGNSIPELLPDLTAKVREGYDLVIASRYYGNAKSDDDDAVTAFGNWMFTRIVNILFGAAYTDTLVIYRAYRREAISHMRLHEMSNQNWLRRHCFYLNSWELGSSIRAALLKLEVAEIAGDEPGRIGGERKLSVIKNGTGALAQVIMDYFTARRLLHP
ncbi:Undecaprenyl-phosphate 4-deoxy-4-formamido-L-arabinose transferase [Candidatus Entotheonellaceae bacterium PAL068K]